MSDDTIPLFPENKELFEYSSNRIGKEILLKIGQKVHIDAVANLQVNGTGKYRWRVVEGFEVDYEIGKFEEDPAYYITVLGFK